MNQSCWQVLGLSDESDSGTIKRRYAQLLKVTRPDDDPQAFQCLREAYEAALQQARRSDMHASLQVVALEIEAVQAPSEPAAWSDHHPWLNEIFAELSVAQLDAHLLQARERDCQPMFEARLLTHCLAAGNDAIACVQWAVDALRWLTPWQSSALAHKQTEQLAAQLLNARIAELAQWLAEGQESRAFDGLTALLRSPWLESVDRQAQAREALLEWLASDENRTPAMVERLFDLLGIDDKQAREYRQHWALTHLHHYLAKQAVLRRLRKQLAMTWPVRHEEQAAWLLFKDMSASEGRRLSDAVAPDVWEACATLEFEMRHEVPELVPALREQGIQNWRKWLARAEGVWLNLWLMLLVMLATAAPGWVKIMGGAPLPDDLGAKAVATVGAGVITMLLVRWVGRGVDRIARHFAGADAWISARLLPRFVANDGAGFLLLRHGVPCALLGAVYGGWASGLGPYAPLFGSAVGLGAVAYALQNLRSNEPTSGRMDALRDFWQRRKATFGWALVAVLIVCFVAIRNVQFSTAQQLGAGQSCQQKVGEWGLKCEQRPAGAR